MGVAEGKPKRLKITTKATNGQTNYILDFTQNRVKITIPSNA